MKRNLLEAYKNRLEIAERSYAMNHIGERLDQRKKIATARCLANIETQLNEAFNNSMGTQRSDMGMFKKFTMNLTNVAVPNLIAFDIVRVYPMSSISGYITYINYTAGSNKGQISQGHVFNNPFGLGDVDSNYTSSRVNSTIATIDASNAQAEVEIKWYPVVPGTVKLVSGTTTIVDDGNGNLIEVPSGGSVVRRLITETTSSTTNVISPTPVRVEIKVFDNAGVEVTTPVGTVFYGPADIANSNAPVGSLAGKGAGIIVSPPMSLTDVALTYQYNNVVIPQNDLPIYNAEIKSIPLIAKSRRIGIYFSQIAAFQAKTDYGLELGDQLAEQAVGELQYEIDTEICQLLIDNAPEDNDLVWSKTLPVGVSMKEHYYSFLEVLEKAATKIYNRTKRFSPNYILVARDVLQVISFIDGFVAAPTTNINGPYFAGTLRGLKVFVTPAMPSKQFVVGLNGSDMMSTAAVYAPYMPIIPTQLLSFADGGMSQGFSTMYALEMLNPSLIVSGRITA